MGQGTCLKSGALAPNQAVGSSAGGGCRGKSSGISLGGCSAPSEMGYEKAKRREHALISFSKEGSQDVLADSVPPEVISAVAAREGGGGEVDPVSLRAAGDAIAPLPESGGVQRETPFEAVQGHTSSGVEVDAGIGEIPGRKDVGFHAPNIARNPRRRERRAII